MTRTQYNEMNIVYKLANYPEPRKYYEKAADGSLTQITNHNDIEDIVTFMYEGVNEDEPFHNHAERRFR